MVLLAKVNLDCEKQTTDVYNSHKYNNKVFPIIRFKNNNLQLAFDQRNSGLLFNPNFTLVNM